MPTQSDHRQQIETLIAANEQDVDFYTATPKRFYIKGVVIMGRFSFDRVGERPVRSR